MGWKILKYNPGEKSLKASFAIYLDLECLLKKEQSRENNNNNNNNNSNSDKNNNLGKSYTEKKARHELNYFRVNLINLIITEKNCVKS